MVIKSHEVHRGVVFVLSAALVFLGIGIGWKLLQHGEHMTGAFLIIGQIQARLKALDPAHAAEEAAHLLIHR